MIVYGSMTQWKIENVKLKIVVFVGANEFVGADDTAIERFLCHSERPKGVEESVSLRCGSFDYGLRPPLRMTWKFGSWDRFSL